MRGFASGLSGPCSWTLLRGFLKSQSGTGWAVELGPTTCKTATGRRASDGCRYKPEPSVLCVFVVSVSLCAIGSVPCVRAFVSGLGPLGSLLLVKEF